MARVVLAVLVLTRRPSLRRLVAPAVLSAAVAIVLVAARSSRAVLARPPGRRESAAASEVQMFSATPSDYLRAHFRSAIYGIAHAAGPAAGAGALSRRRADRPRCRRPGAAARFASASPTSAGLLLAFDGSLGFNGLTYPLLYDWFSPIRGLRVPARVQCAGCVEPGRAGRLRRAAAARGARDHGGVAALMFAATVVAAVVNVWPILPLREVWPEPPPVYGALAGAPHVVLAEFPVADDYGFNTPYMYFSLWHWAADGQRLQRLHARQLRTVPARTSRTFPARRPCATLKMRRRDARDGQLRALSRRLRRVAGPPRRDS